jgi:hypothetical protein
VTAVEHHASAVEESSPLAATALSADLVAKCKACAQEIFHSYQLLTASRLTRTTMKSVADICGGVREESTRTIANLPPDVHKCGE